MSELYISGTIAGVMFRRQALFVTNAIRGSPPVSTRKSRVIIHGSQLPAKTADVDFSTLGLKYPLTGPTTFAIEKTCWHPAPTVLPSLPFAVDRTDIGQSFPVYTDIKGGKTKVVTLVRKIRGDVHELKSELEKVTGTTVEIKAGRLEVKGNFRKRIKKWLLGLGF